MPETYNPKANTTFMPPVKLPVNPEKKTRYYMQSLQILKFKMFRNNS
jgi:hypothetical protein